MSSKRKAAQAPAAATNADGATSQSAKRRKVSVCTFLLLPVILYLVEWWLCVCGDECAVEGLSSGRRGRLQERSLGLARLQRSLNLSFVTSHPAAPFYINLTFHIPSPFSDLRLHYNFLLWLTHLRLKSPAQESAESTTETGLRCLERIKAARDKR